MAIFFTADTHFTKATVIQQDIRPFDNVKEMDEALIANWNGKVGEDDDVYVLGDLTDTKSPDIAMSILEKLNGRIHVITGNHDEIVMRLMSDDEASRHLRDKLVEVTPYKEMTVEDANGNEWFIVMSHYPMFAYNKSSHIGGKGDHTVMLYGHVHYGHEFWELREHMHERDMPWRGVNVGTMVWGYTPVSLDDIDSVLEKPEGCEVSYPSLCRCAYTKMIPKCRGCMYGWYNHANMIETSIEDVRRMHDEIERSGGAPVITNGDFVYCKPM